MARQRREPGARYQLPPLCAEQPPLSADPVSQLRLVVPLDDRESVNDAAPESRLDVTAIS